MAKRLSLRISTIPNRFRFVFLTTYTTATIVFVLLVIWTLLSLITSNLQFLHLLEYAQAQSFQLQEILQFSQLKQ